MKRLFYVRHGESEYNSRGLLAGYTNALLTETGKEQAKQAGKNLKAANTRIDLIVCSPLSRAHETAKIIAKEIGYPLNKIRTNEQLVERSFGVVEGLNLTEYFLTHTYEDLDKEEEVEKIIDLQKRVTQALADIKKLPEENILVVGHGAFGRALRRVVANLPHTAEYDETYRKQMYLGNAEIVELITE